MRSIPVQSPAVNPRHELPTHRQTAHTQPLLIPQPFPRHHLHLPASRMVAGEASGSGVPGGSSAPLSESTASSSKVLYNSLIVQLCTAIGGAQHNAPMHMLTYDHTHTAVLQGRTRPRRRHSEHSQQRRTTPPTNCKHIALKPHPAGCTDTAPGHAYSITFCMHMYRPLSL